jgi:hypothetical protein
VGAEEGRGLVVIATALFLLFMVAYLMGYKEGRGGDR